MTAIRFVTALLAVASRSTGLCQRGTDGYRRLRAGSLDWCRV